MHFFQSGGVRSGEDEKKKKKKKKERLDQKREIKKKKRPFFPFWRKKKCVLDPDVLCWSHKKKRSTRPTKQKLEA